MRRPSKQCCAAVQSSQAIGYRASRDPDLRCQRSGKVETLDWFGRYRWFCEPHARIYREHRKIVKRILSFPIYSGQNG